VEWAANVSKQAKAKDAQINAMAAHIQALANTVATLSKAITTAAKENLNPNPGGGDGGGNGVGGNSGGGNSGGNNSNGLPFHQFTCNTGGYCFPCGYHPVGTNHTSATCKQKRQGHNDSATATNCMNDSTRWLGIRQVTPSQHDHPSYKGQSAPATKPLLPHASLHHDPSHFNSSVTLQRQFSMKTPATSSSTATSSSIPNTEKHGVTHLDRKSDY
jgi:hypothetical protein